MNVRSVMPHREAIAATHVPSPDTRTQFLELPVADDPIGSWSVTHGDPKANANRRSERRPQCAE
jgi:hypothetical protein